MTLAVISKEPRLEVKSICKPWEDCQNIIGFATFDSHGIPIEYHLIGDNINRNWIQTVFQSISLQMLLQISFELQGFSRAVVEGDGNWVEIVKHECGYQAMLFQSKEVIMSAPALAIAAAA